MSVSAAQNGMESDRRVLSSHSNKQPQAAQVAIEWSKQVG
jgi:hypothetical protein